MHCEFATLKEKKDTAHSQGMYKTNKQTEIVNLAYSTFFIIIFAVVLVCNALSSLPPKITAEKAAKVCMNIRIEYYHEWNKSV